MGHDLHFLERLNLRFDEEEQAIALGLYYDAELTRTMLELATLPEGAERVALALRDVAESPHIIVKRSGAFVTCLAAGMSTGGAPVLSRIQLNGLRVRAQRVFEARKLTRPESITNTRQQLNRFGLSGVWTQREDMQTVCALAPLLQTDLLRRSGDAIRTFLKAMTELERSYLPKATPQRSLLRTIERKSATLAWASVCYQMVAAEQPRLMLDMEDLMANYSLGQWGLMTGSLALFGRTAWIAARLGPRYLPHLEDEWRSASLEVELLSSLFPLVAMATRHPSVRAEILALFKHGSPSFSARYGTAYTDALGAVATSVVTSSAAIDDESLLIAQRIEASDYPHHRLRTRFDGPDAVPEEIVRFCFAAIDPPIPPFDELIKYLTRAALIARYPIADFFLPRSSTEQFDTAPDDELNHGMVLSHMQYFAHRTRQYAAPRTERNAPCTCGSGKKFKHCCGRPR